MEEKIYVIKNQDSFELEDIFECGQCFRWNKEEDSSYTGVIKNGVINVKKIGNEIIFKGICDKEIKNVVEEYFDLTRDYSKIKKQLSEIDTYMKTSVEYGKEIDWNGKKYYTFPTPEELKEVSVEDYRKLGLGFRDIRLYETTKMILENKVDLQKLRENPDTKEVREQLLTLSGVGTKVADCILLFSDLKRFEVFPIDVWVRRVMNDLYIKEEDETKVSKVKIEKIANEKFGSLAGLAQQYLFYWRRMA